MPKLEKIDVMAAVKMQAIILGHVGLLCGIVYSFGGAIYELTTSSLNTGTVLAFGALIGMPLIGAVFGAVAAVIGAAMHNMLFARQ